MTNSGPGDFIKAGDWDDYALELWDSKPEKLIASALEQAKIGSENHKLAHGSRNTTADFNKYSGRARDAEARQTRHPSNTSGEGESSGRCSADGDEHRSGPRHLGFGRSDDVARNQLLRLFRYAKSDNSGGLDDTSMM